MVVIMFVANKDLFVANKDWFLLTKTAQVANKKWRRENRNRLCPLQGVLNKVLKK